VDIKTLLQTTNTTHNLSTLVVIQNFYKYGYRQTPLIVIEDKKVNMSALQALDDDDDITSIAIMTPEVGIEQYGVDAKHGVIEINSTSRFPNSTEGYDNLDISNGAVIRPESYEGAALVEPIPLFPGCKTIQCSKEELLKYIYTNIKYPKKMLAKNAQGVLTLEITIDEKGQTSGGFSILQSKFSNDFDEKDIVDDLIDLYNGLGSKGIWTPRIVDDHAVSTVMRIPIVLKIDKVNPVVLRKLKSEQEEPEHEYDIEFDEIVVVGHGNSNTEPSKN